jgi:hypothetical protein
MILSLKYILYFILIFLHSLFNTVLLSKFELMRKLRFQLRYDYVLTIKLLL